MTDHHDHFPYEDELPYDDPPFPDPLAHDPALDDPHPADPHPGEPHAEPADLPREEANPDPVPDLSAEATGEPGAVDVFPPAVDVGDLPEPVDGFPWIDSGSLGLADIAAAADQADLDPVQPEELAEYAAAELPPGVDPWAELAGSEDPATSNLARWWSPN